MLLKPSLLYEKSSNFFEVPDRVIILDAFAFRSSHSETFYKIGVYNIHRKTPVPAYFFSEKLQASSMQPYQERVSARGAVL